MAVSSDISTMFGLNSKLSKSASALETALAQLGKTNPLATDATPSTDNVYIPTTTNEGNGFDEWLANDLQIGSLYDETSTAGSSPISATDDSPLLGFDALGAENVDSLDFSSLFDMSTVFPTNLNTFSTDFLTLLDPLVNSTITEANTNTNTTTTSTAPAFTAATATSIPAASVTNIMTLKNTATFKPPTVLTSEAVQRAAAALNIPYSIELEKAVMAQAYNSGNQTTSIPKVETVESVHDHAPVITAITSSAADATTNSNTSATSAINTTSLDSASFMITADSRLKSKNKRTVPLTPEEEMEEMIAKRAKNTDAARRSRLKKLLKLEGLEAKVAELESANNRLNMKVAVLESEKNGHIVKEAEQSARIAQLEAKLAEAHLALTSRV